MGPLVNFAAAQQAGAEHPPRARLVVRIGVTGHQPKNLEQADFTLLRARIREAMTIVREAARDAIAGTLKPQQIDLPSQLWSHPTIWFYIRAGLQRGAW